MKRENPFDEIPEDRTAVDNILRINVTNQMRLTVMADQKANIMITVASIVFSVTVANLDNEVMKWPLLFFAFVALYHFLQLYLQSYQRQGIRRSRGQMR